MQRPLHAMERPATLATCHAHSVHSHMERPATLATCQQLSQKFSQKFNRRLNGFLKVLSNGQLVSQKFPQMFLKSPTGVSKVYPKVFAKCFNILVLTKFNKV